MSNPWYGYAHIGALSPETKLAIVEWAVAKDLWPDTPDNYMQISQFAELYFRLKYEADDPDLFPKGKWATLQRMENLIEDGLKP